MKLRIKFLIILNILLLKNFNKLTAENLAARLKQANLVSKTNFDNKLSSCNKRITSNKRKHLKVKKKLNSLIRKYNNFFFGRICFTSNAGSQNTFAYQPTVDTLELQKDKSIKGNI